jgi:hypothetical protein
MRTKKFITKESDILCVNIDNVESRGDARLMQEKAQEILAHIERMNN